MGQMERTEGLPAAMEEDFSAAKVYSPAAEEDSPAAEDFSGGLEVRRLRRRIEESRGDEGNGAPSEDEFGGNNQRSVHFDEAEGVWKCRHCMWTYHLSGPCIDYIQNLEGYCQVEMDVETLYHLGTYIYSPIKGIEFPHFTDGIKTREVDHFIDEKDMGLDNGKAVFETKELNNQVNISANVEIQNSKNETLENGPRLHLSFDMGTENGNTVNEIEIEENIQVRMVTKSKLEVAEIDLERVLDEQETHDLFCPNCNSCITKRVILRKRKRTKEIQDDAPPSKIHGVEHDVDATTNASTGMTEMGPDKEPDVFRCLSCFSFFIPTESGFNIFRIFGKKEESKGLQTSQQLPVTNTKWISSIFKSKASMKKGSETGLSLPTENVNTRQQQTSESPLNIQPSLAASASGALNTEANNITARKNETENILQHVSMDKPTFLVGSSQITQNIHGSLLPASAMVLPHRDTEGEPVSMHKPTFLDGSSQITQNIHGSLLPVSAVVLSHQDTEIYVNEHVSMDKPTFLDGSSQISQNIHGSLLPVSAVVLSHQDTEIYVNEHVSMDKPTFLDGPSQISQNIHGSLLPTSAVVLTHRDTEIYVGELVSMDKSTFLDGSSQITKNIHSSLLPDNAVVLPHRDTEIYLGEPVSMDKPTCLDGSAQITQIIHGSLLPTSAVVLPHQDTEICVGEPSSGRSRRNDEWDMLKSIVYGGLIESITSLGVLSSAAGTDATTLNIVALGLANLVGGLFVIAHDLSELRGIQEEATDENGRYWQILGRRGNFRLHAVVAVVTYLLVGLLPPVIYGFAFRTSDDKEYKLIAVASASMLCIALLAIGKAHVRPHKDYIKSLVYYLALGVAASGLSFVAGMMIHRLLKQLGLFDGFVPRPPSTMYGDLSSMQGMWSSS